MTEEQREILGRVQALMSLLEGHANYVMDVVGAENVPGADRMRRGLHDRRKSSGIERSFQRLIGFESKVRQYDVGERFVATVVERAGMAGFNRVWDDPGEPPHPGGGHGARPVARARRAGRPRPTEGRPCPGDLRRWPGSSNASPPPPASTRCSNPGDLVMVMVSGGPDSTCLLHSLHLLRRLLKIRLVVVHVDHRLRPDSGKDAAYVRRMCAGLKVPFVLRTAASSPAEGDSIEAWARTIRYAAAADAAHEAGANRLATGHTLDDQAETVLIQLIRGGRPRRRSPASAAVGRGPGSAR